MAAKSGGGGDEGHIWDTGVGTGGAAEAMTPSLFCQISSKNLSLLS